MTTPAWWSDALAATTLPELPLPGFLDGLAGPIVDSAPLGPQQVRQLLLAAAGGEAGRPLVAAVRERADRSSLDRFAVAVLTGWPKAGVTRFGWLLTATGALGHDGYVAALAPMVRGWTMPAHMPRCRAGLAALCTVGTPAALQEVAAVAARGKKPRMREAAAEALAGVARERGLTDAQLEDRMVPTGGLDARGTLVLDYGPRRFLVALAPDLSLVVRDLVDGRPTGRARASAPAPGTKDDPVLGAAAKDACSVLKKTLTGVRRSQTRRFEDAMVDERRWDAADHAAHVAGHPVLRRLLGGVVWDVRDGGGALLTTARIDADATLVDRDDAAVAAEGATLGVAHPVMLDDEALQGWREVLADLDLASPFPQLDRVCFRLAPGQARGSELAVLPTEGFPTGRLLGAVSRFGWERGEPEDGGQIHAFHRWFPAHGVTAVAVVDDGVAVYDPMAVPDQGLRDVHVLRGRYHEPDHGYRDRRMDWADVPAVVASEALALVDAMSPLSVAPAAS